MPVIKQADKKSIVQLAVEILELAKSAREGKLKPDQMKEGTFTITSVGNLGGEVFTPIINYPESAILGIGKISEKPVVREGQIVIRKMVTLSLSYDHRIIDGADAARFMATLIEALEDPVLLLMEVN